MKISIIGASGTLGSCTAFNIIVNRLADEVLMIGHQESPLKAHWMDLSTAATGTDIVVRRGSYEDMAGSDIIIVAAGVPSGVITSRRELLLTNLSIVREVAEQVGRYCPEAIVITQTNPVDPLNYTMYIMGKTKVRWKYIGYGLNDTIRFRMWVALALGISSKRVQGIVLGEHGNSQVMLFSSIRVDGKPAEIDEKFKKEIRAKPPITLHEYETLVPKRTSGWTSAVGTAAIINAIKNNTREVLPCSVVLDGEYGVRGLSMTVPAVIGQNGVESVNVLELTPDEKAGLEKSVSVLSPLMRFVEQELGGGK